MQSQPNRWHIFPKIREFLEDYADIFFTFIGKNFNAVVLLHLVIDPWEIFFEQSIACTAFVARVSSSDSIGFEKYKQLIDAPEEVKKVFGVFIDYINPLHKKEWEIYIDYLRKSDMV